MTTPPPPDDDLPEDDPAPDVPGHPLRAEDAEALIAKQIG
jgi:hypothetical protein